MSLGFSEILLIVIFVLLVFGPKRIPELARALGKLSAEVKKFKKSLSDETCKLTENAGEADDE